MDMGILLCGAAIAGLLVFVFAFLLMTPEKRRKWRGVYMAALILAVGYFGDLLLWQVWSNAGIVLAVAVLGGCLLHGKNGE